MSTLALKDAYFGKWARKYVTDEYSESFTSEEGIDDFAPLSESGSIKDLTTGTGYKVSVSSDEYAGKLVVTKKMRIRAKDDTVKLGQFLSKDLKKITESARRHMEFRAHALLDNGFVTDGSVTSGKGIVLAPDATALFGTHTWNSTGETFSNKGTGKFTMAVWEAAVRQMGNLTDAYGAKLPVDLKVIVVKKNGDAAYRMKRLFFGKVYADTVDLVAATSDINIHEGNKDGIKIIETPYLSDENAWFAFDPAMENPFVVKVVQNPIMEDRIKRENLDWVYPSTMSYEVGCTNMPYMWYGSNGTT